MRERERIMVYGVMRRSTKTRGLYVRGNYTQSQPGNGDGVDSYSDAEGESAIKKTSRILKYGGKEKKRG